MLLSTSSSNERLPLRHWAKTWLFVSLALLSFVLYFEFNLRQTGWSPSIVDSKELWSMERHRLSTLGSNGLALLGASRMQLGMDLRIIRAVSLYEPVQLAIDGSSFMPVLKGIVNDESVNGTIIIAVSVHDIMPDTKNDMSISWVNFYNIYYKDKQFIEPYKVINNKVKTYLSSNLALKLEGAKPATVILARAFDNTAIGNYLVMSADRSRSADYSKVRMPDFYLQRLSRNFGKDIKGTSKEDSPDNVLLNYKQEIKLIKPMDNTQFMAGLDDLLNYINLFESRGGKIFLVRFPTDKLILEIDKKRYPRELFWNELAKRHDKSIYYADYPELTGFNLPDGSHLDFRDKRDFTAALMKIIMKNY